MSNPPGVVSRPAQIRLLVRVFLDRLFENGFSSGRTDLRAGLLWLIAALGTPGIVLPLYQQFHWNALLWGAHA